MKSIFHLALAAAFSLACLASPALAQQHVPTAVGASGSAVTTQPVAQVVAPAGGGEGAGCVVSPDACPLPTGGIQVSVVVAPTVTAASAYASGNNLGTVQTLTNAARVSGGTVLLQKVVLNFKSAQTAQTDILIFNASPASSTFTDKTAVTVNTLDFDKLAGVVHVSDCTPAGTVSQCQATGLALSLKANGSQNLYAVAVTRGTPTFTATTDFSMNFVFIQD